MRRPPLFLAIFGLVLVTLLVSQAASLALLALVRPPPPAAQSVEGIADRLTRGDWNDVLRSRMTLTPPRFNPGDGETAPRLARRLADLLAVPPGDVVVNLARMQRGRYILVETQRGGAPRLETALVGDFTISIRQPDGRWRQYSPIGEAIFDRVEQRYILLFLLGALIMLPLAWWLSRLLASPLAQLASVAEQLGRDPSTTVPPIRGPIEIQRAGDALGVMARQLNAWVTNRTQMVGALAHDLRTPLTRLSFRVEQLPPDQRDQMLGDVAEMEAMVAQTLDYVRGVSMPALRERIELLSLLEQVADHFALTGRDVTAEGQSQAIVEGDPLSLRRLFTNLIDNGLAYGGKVRVWLETRSGEVIVRVEDNGPGLPESELARVVEPFYRAEPSRNRTTGGMGLGLSIARAIAVAHGGSIALSNRPEGGLAVIVRLPLAANPAQGGAQSGRLAGTAPPVAGVTPA